MLQSKLFTKTRKEAPKDEESLNAKLLIRGGFIHKEMAGVYDYLPLGLRVLSKINNIIREEMDAIGGEEVYLSALQSKELWQKTGRFSDEVVDNWFKTTLKGGGELGLGFTHEEPLTNIMKDHISSYRDLPIYAYQIQTKFRNEKRAKSGILRGREFLMKDLYSFSKDDTEHAEFYEKAKGAYMKIFGRVGLGDITHITFASGGSFSQYSHEFQTLLESGEDTIFLCNKCRVAINEDIAEGDPKCPECGSTDLQEKKSVEVGNIFNLGTKFSDALGLLYKDENGEKKPVVMGSYGIGPGRVFGTVVEVFGGENEVVFPESVSPFDIHLIYLPDANGDTKKEADKVYDTLMNEGFDVLYDDRDLRAGEKLGDADLIGIPKRIVIGEKSLSEGEVEYRNRISGEERNIKVSNINKKILD